MQVMILSVSSGVRKDKTPYFKATISPQDSEGTVVAGMDFYIQPEDYANLAGKVPCVAQSGYKFRPETNGRGFQALGIAFGGFVDIQPLFTQAVPPAALPSSSQPAPAVDGKAAKSA